MVKQPLGLAKNRCRMWLLCVEHLCLWRVFVCCVGLSKYLKWRRQMTALLLLVPTIILIALRFPWDLEVRDANGKSPHEIGSIAFVDPARLRDRPLEFSVYELGKMVALYERGKPNFILAIADLSLITYYLSLGSGDFEKYEEFSGRLERLKQSFGNSEMELEKCR